MIFNVTLSNGIHLPLDTSDPDCLHTLLAVDTTTQEKIIALQTAMQIDSTLDIDRKRQGWTPIQLACKLGDVRLVKAFLIFGAKPNQRLDNQSPTALMLAAASECCSQELIHLLLIYGANAKLHASNGSSVFSYLQHNLSLTDAQKEVIKTDLREPTNSLAKQQLLVKENNQLPVVLSDRIKNLSAHNIFAQFHKYLCQKQYEGGTFSTCFDTFKCVLLRIHSLKDAILTKKTNADVVVKNELDKHPSGKKGVLGTLFCAERFYTLRQTLYEMESEAIMQDFQAYINFVNSLKSISLEAQIQFGAEVFYMDRRIVDPLYDALNSKEEKVQNGKAQVKEEQRRRSTIRGLRD